MTLPNSAGNGGHLNLNLSTHTPKNYTGQQKEKKKSTYTNPAPSL